MQTAEGDPSGTSFLLQRALGASEASEALPSYYSNFGRHQICSSCNYIVPQNTGSCCDYCHNNFPCSMGRYNCNYCKFDVCQNCYNMMVKPPMPPMPPMPFGGGKMCQMGHPLQFTYSTANSNFGCFKCSSCNEPSVACSLGRWACFNCNYNVCTKCMPAGGMPAPMPSPMPAPMPAPMPGPYGPPPGPYPSPYPSPYGATSTCKMGHPLTHTTNAAGYWDGMYQCAMCMAKYGCSTGRFSCVSCHYDLCKNCKPYQFILI
eukprot:TRINITY_DN5346_c0_g1_i1.p1 TRINITY_DN5346_c0_g1~~TRINITY_DN5346_c0_g1_i1.p1  ORF type:complete len:261 (+),score=-14.32 TRINITY_DN5346_c0_g1_i1:531-1313(+)